MARVVVSCRAFAGWEEEVSCVIVSLDARDPFGSPRGVSRACACPCPPLSIVASRDAQREALNERRLATRGASLVA